MARHKGRGYSSIEYPTGMNQNGDPSQAWIKIKPDGRVDVFSGTSDIGNGSKTIQTPDRRRDARRPVRVDHVRQLEHRLLAALHRHVRLARDVRRRRRRTQGRAFSAREKLLEIAGKELEIDPDDLDVVDGEVIAKGAPQKKISVPDVAAAATWGHGELITGTGAQLKPLVPIDGPHDGRRRHRHPTPPSRMPHAQPRSRWTTRRARSM